MEPVKYIGIIEYAPKGKSNAVTTKQAGQWSSSYRHVETKKHVDKQTGSYARATVKDKYSTGDVYKERSTGRVGYKEEITRTKTFKCGDKSGFTEYQVEERYRVVNYGNSSIKGKKSGSSSGRVEKSGSSSSKVVKPGSSSSKVVKSGSSKNLK